MAERPRGLARACAGADREPRLRPTREPACRSEAAGAGYAGGEPVAVLPGGAAVAGEVRAREARPRTNLRSSVLAGGLVRRGATPAGSVDQENGGVTDSDDDDSALQPVRWLRIEVRSGVAQGNGGARSRIDTCKSSLAFSTDSGIIVRDGTAYVFKNPSATGAG